MYQFNGLLAQLGKRISWETQVAGLALGGGKFDESLHPLSPSTGRYRKEKGPDSGELDSFINKMNKMNAMARGR